MTIDYAKQTPQPRFRRRGLWLLSIIIILAVICFAVVFFYKHKHNTQQTKQPVHLTQHNYKPVIEKLAIPKQQFDFYNMLPKMQVAVNKKNPHAAQVAAGQPYFLLQVATTSDTVAAQKLVTKLGVMGVSSYMKPYTTTDGKSLYRILVGPYLTKKNANTDQAYLHTNHINSMLLNLTATQ
ncbi:MAG: hypothetical protein COB66_07460 [Coxiella sp. (in: Bacteria)]|nr:MAG: hypothetical protein COB66_07460 [Coxiella sp. (in: g-proteobacteria)]